MSKHKKHLGVIEGYFGALWDWAARKSVVTRLAAAGYGYFIYAPKADAFLRRKWQEPYPAAEAEALADFAAHCRTSGLRFGIGLSPFEAYMDFNAEKQAALKSRIAFFNKLGVEDLAILFDDMRGDIPDLARKQAEILTFVRAHSTATRFIMCPSYYSADPVLDKVFGARPPHYLKDLGRLLPQGVEVFWTGEKVCSPSYSAAHLKAVNQELGRKVFIWDNYPVNDGARMSNHLHLRAFNNSAAALARHTAGHAINPALQPHLGLIPALTLPETYRLRSRYDPRAAFEKAVRKVAPDPKLATEIIRDAALLQDKGLNHMTAGEKQKLREKYAAFCQKPAHEIVRWLDGHYTRKAGEAVLTQ